jgi:hypothetical protein
MAWSHAVVSYLQGVNDMNYDDPLCSCNDIFHRHRIPMYMIEPAFHHSAVLHVNYEGISIWRPCEILDGGKGACLL